MVGQQASWQSSRAAAVAAGVAEVQLLPQQLAVPVC